MNDTDFEQFGYHAVQFVGGYVDGREMWVYELKPEYQWAIMEDLSEMLRHPERSDLLLPVKKAVYKRLKDSTIYIYKGIR